MKTGVAIDFKKALAYPLCPVPLSISNADGTKRSTAKSKLKDIILSEVPNENPDENEKRRSILLVDSMALINLMTKIPTTYEELAHKFVKMIPKSYKQVDIIADNYSRSENSIKICE